MPIVEIYGKQVEFPDDLQGDQLNAAVSAAAKQMSGQSEAPRKTSQQVSQDAFSSAWQATRGASPLATGVKQGAVQVGRGVYDLGVGLGQFGVDALNMLPGVNVDRSGLDLMAQQSAEAGKYLSEQPAGVIGPIAGGMAATLPVAAMKAPQMLAKPIQAAMSRSPVLASTGVGAGTGAIAGAVAPVTKESGRAENIASGALGGAVGGAIAGAAGRAVTPVVESADPYRERLVRMADAMGVKLTPGQRSGSVPLQQLEASLSSNPLTSGPLSRLREQNQKAINKAVASSFGEDADVLTPEVIDRAFTRIGKKFDVATQGVRVPLDDKFRSDLGGVLSEYRSTLPSLQNPKIEALVQDLEGLIPQQGNAKLKGEVYQKIVSDLSRVARSAARGENADMDYARALLGIKEVMDDSASRAMTPEARAMFKEARGQYRNLITAVNSGAIKSENVSPKVLKNAMARKDRIGMARGRDSSEMAKAGRVGEYFAPVVGDSGTATRMSIPLMAGGGVASGLAALSAGAPASVALGAAAAPLMLGAVGNVGGRAYLSQPAQRYFGNTLLDLTSRQAVGTGGGLLGYLLSNQ